MGGKSDWPTMKMACEILKELEIPFESKVISAHRTPDRLYEFAKNLESRNIKVVIAGAGGAAHLPGMVASLTHIPVIGVPVKSSQLNGVDSLLSICQMPAGIPVATMSIGVSGAKNAALMALSILAVADDSISAKYKLFRARQTESIQEEIC